MKAKFFMAAMASGLLLLTSCGGGAPTAKDIKEAAPKTQEDSLSYYFGTQIAGIYDQMCMTDTTLKTDANKQEFLKAFGDAMAHLDGKSEAYIGGYTAALQLILQSTEINKQPNVKLNPTMIGSGFAYAMQADSLRKNTDGAQYIQKTLMALSEKKQKADTQAAQGALAKMTSKGYQKVDPSLYKKTIKAGDGAALTAESRVKVSMSLTGPDGKPVNMPMPQEVVVGQSFGPNSPLTKGMLGMKVGENTSFALPSSELFPGQQKRFGLNDSDPVIVTVNVLELLPAQKPQGKAVTPGAPQPVEVQPAGKPAEAPAKGAK